MSVAVEGIGGYQYNKTVKDGGVSFHFYDPEDTNNTADASVSEKDYPEGVTHADARQVVDVAYALVQKQLDDKRDTRLKREATEQLEKQIDNQARTREATNDFLANAKEISDTGIVGVTDTSKESETTDQSDTKKK